jgi:PAS domain S-box-containing protein
MATAIREHREEAEQARLLLTARLQEQAAQLQETVGLRTRELREANAHLRAGADRLQQLHDRLALATRSAALGVWEWDAATQRSQWDARTLEIYGLTPEQYHGTGDDWLQRVHPDDRARAREGFLAILAGANHYDQEFRIVRARDGAVRHIESRAIVVRDPAGKLLRVTGTDRDITAEREAAEQAATLNERLRLALRSSNFGVWELDAATQRLVWDEHMFDIYGVPRAAFDGSRETWVQRLHPDDRDHAVELARQVIAGELPHYDTEFRIVRPDGAVRYIEAHGYVQRDPSGRAVRLVGLNRDVTERRQLEERVRKSEELAAQVGELALIGGWEFNTETRQLTWTDGVRRIHEVDDAFQPTVENTAAFYPPETRALLQEAFTAPDPARPAFDHEFALVTLHGRHRWVRLLGRAEFRADGKAVRVHGAMQDITARHESEESRRELETQLFQAQKMETLGTLAGGIAHDFNNLLTGIIGYHELAADSVPEDHPARACLTEARNASLRARELVEQILTFGRQTPGGSHVPLDLAPVAEEARRFLRATLPANIALELQVAADCPHVLGDATQIHQVLLNLGSNSAHAMRAHGGTLTISIAPAEVTPDLAHLLGGPTAAGYVRLSVADTGHGMDEATRRRIFDPFFTTKNTREGTGLGLAVVHGIVRAHRGAIDVESTPGAGATFHIYLPAATAENETDELDLGEAPRGEGEFIVVVDDEEVVGSCTKLVLESKGYQVMTFTAAEQCLASLADESASCALLVTDQTMPGMQGTELVAAARKRNPQLPVVIMSGYFSKISPQELDELGQVELLAKPFTTDELTAAVHRALHPAPAKA